MDRDDPFKQFEKLVNAEDYLGFFGISYNPQVVHVNRLHILKKFALLREEIDREKNLHDSEERLSRYKEAMQRAYETFLASTAPEQRLFKVFQQPPPGLVMIKLDK